eukprot:1156859-Pelagomonas_calceolata.AAC.5
MCERALAGVHIDQMHIHQWGECGSGHMHALWVNERRHADAQQSALWVNERRHADAQQSANPTPAAQLKLCDLLI